jgi:hypothetical protein
MPVMKSYTLHLPRDAHPGDPDALETADLVPDAFAWGALFLTFLWCFYHRLWLAGLGVLALLAGVLALLASLDVPGFPSTVAVGLVLILIGLEGNSLRRWTLARRGRPAVDVVTAVDRDEAAMKAVARWSRASARSHARGGAGPLAAAPYRGPDPIIGLFPEVEGRR